MTQAEIKEVTDRIEQTESEPNSGWLLGRSDPDSEPIMPLGKVHVIGGASGAGKTTLLFQLLKCMAEGQPWFGIPVAQVPFVYCTLDRDWEETVATCKRVGLDWRKLPFFEGTVELPNPNQEVDTRAEQLLGKLRNKFPEAKVIIIDGFMMLAAKGRMNDYLYMSEWLQRMRNYCKRNGITIVGIVHTTKIREGERILDPRQKILGSVAGAGFTNCMVLVERCKPEDADQRRKIHVLPRNSADMAIEAVVDNKGCLRPDEHTEGDAKWFLEGILARASEPLAVGAIINQMAKVNASRSTVYRLLKQMVEEGKAETCGVGRYRATSETAPWEG